MKDIYEMLNDVDMNIEEYDNQKLSEYETQKIKKQISKEIQGMNSKKLIKPAVAVAACAAVAVGVINIPNIPSLNRTENMSKTADNTKTPDLISEVRNHFVLQVNAQTLDDTNGVAITNHGGREYGGICSDNDVVAYISEFPISCEGENIKEITYSITGATFDVSTNTDDAVLLDYEVSDLFTYPWVTMDNSDFNEALSSFTVAYDKQITDSTYIGIGYSTDFLSKDKAKLILDYTKKSDIKDIEKDKAIYDELYKDIVITCTVEYNDGTTETKEMGVSAKIGKNRDLHDDRIAEEDLDNDIIIPVYKIR
ncbi:MAG: hypothetical protein E7254_09645 [Lachnospiraceae bacterium]|nr:hypothetical protein [Lachnospiraceae bacterium]